MENRQTAIEWLIEQYNLYRPGQMPQTQFSKVCEQAIAMEKQQIMDAYENGENRSAELYYKETYGK